MKMKHKIFILLSVMILGFNISYSQDKAFISPGLKIGYELGDKGGWTIGMEVSYVMDFKNITYLGLVINYDFLNNKHKILLGVEYLLPPLPVGGITIGPSILIDKKNNVHFGASVIPFLGLWGYFYYDYSFFYTHQAIENMGLYLKIPLQVQGSNYSI